MKIVDAFQKGTAFIPFITCGDPDLATTKELIRALIRGGADLIELGIPFSDPTAEGETIQKANLRALNVGTTPKKIFQMLEEMQQEAPITVPLVFMTYANVVYHYGIEAFAQRCQQVGICGLILPDVPLEEKAEFAPLCQKYGVEFVSLIAPTSEHRIAQIAQDAQGFVYCVSSMGVTGVRTSLADNVNQVIGQIKESTKIPVAVGFGIATPDQAKALGSQADGIIVGSAIIKLIQAHGTASPSHVEAYAKEMKAAANQGR